jgi:hypothetical protein
MVRQAMLAAVVAAVVLLLLLRLLLLVLSGTAPVASNDSCLSGYLLLPHGNKLLRSVTCHHMQHSQNCSFASPVPRFNVQRHTSTSTAGTMRDEETWGDGAPLQHHFGIVHLNPEP